jgi:hypothetical protein
MDSFEAVVAAIFQRQGYWTQTSVKVELTKAEKVAIKRPSSPRWELDVVGYRGASNELLVDGVSRTLPTKRCFTLAV